MVVERLIAAQGYRQWQSQQRILMSNIAGCCFFEATPVAKTSGILQRAPQAEGELMAFLQWDSQPTAAMNTLHPLVRAGFPYMSHVRGLVTISLCSRDHLAGKNRLPGMSDASNWFTDELS